MLFCLGSLVGLLRLELGVFRFVASKYSYLRENFAKNK